MKLARWLKLEACVESREGWLITISALLVNKAWRSGSASGSTCQPPSRLQPRKRGMSAFDEYCTSLRGHHRARAALKRGQLSPALCTHTAWEIHRTTECTHRTCNPEALESVTPLHSLAQAQALAQVQTAPDGMSCQLRCTFTRVQRGWRHIQYNAKPALVRIANLVIFQHCLTPFAVIRRLYQLVACYAHSPCLCHA